MAQDSELDQAIRQRIRTLRLARNWTLETLALRAHLSPSNLSRIETGQRRIALDQLVPLARALGTTLDDLIASESPDDVVIRPRMSAEGEVTVWILSDERSVTGMTVAKMRISADRRTDQMVVHAGRDWFTVLAGTAELRLGERTILVREGESARFSTTTPHMISGHGGPVEIITIVDHAGERSHLPESH